MFSLCLGWQIKPQDPRPHASPGRQFWFHLVFFVPATLVWNAEVLVMLLCLKSWTKRLSWHEVPSSASCGSQLSYGEMGEGTWNILSSSPLTLPLNKGWLVIYNWESYVGVFLFAKITRPLLPGWLPIGTLGLLWVVLFVKYTWPRIFFVEVLNYQLNIFNDYSTVHGSISFF